MSWTVVGSLLLQISTPVSIATDVWPPFRQIQNGQLMGYDLEMMQGFAEHLDLQFTWLQMPWVRALHELEQGRIPLMTGVAYTPERATYLHYLPEPYKECRSAFYGLPDYAQQLNTYEDLSNFLVGYVRASAYFARFDQDSSLNKQGVASESQLLQMAERGHVQLMIGTDCQVDYELSKLDSPLVKAPWQPPDSVKLYIVLSIKGSTPELQQQLWQAQLELKQQGFFDALNQRYFAQSLPLASESD